MKFGEHSRGRRKYSGQIGLWSGNGTQLQPQPPPQQLPPPPENPPDDLAEAPLLEPFAELNTES
jgi:hypothetical protein